MFNGGPENFVNRLNSELDHYSLPEYTIINPHPNQRHKLNKDCLKIGRLNGAYYYKTTSLNLYNLVLQRRGIKLPVLKYIPDYILQHMTKPLNWHLNKGNRMLIKNCDCLVFQSKLSKKMHEIFVTSFIKKKNKIILNGVPTNIFCPKKSQIKLDGFPKLVITASYRPHKRLQDAIEIVNYMQKSNKYIKLHVIGEMDNITKQYISGLDVSNTVFHGRIKSEDLPEFYSGCDVGLSPSLFDPCPNSVIEMVACGLPVITTKDSGASEIVKYDDLIIQENINLSYMELQTINTLPKVSVHKWSKCIENILWNKKYFVEKMLQRVKDELDISKVAEKYNKFILEQYNAAC